MLLLFQMRLCVLGSKPARNLCCPQTQESSIPFLALTTWKLCTIGVGIENISVLSWLLGGQLTVLTVGPSDLKGYMGGVSVFLLGQSRAY